MTSPFTRYAVGKQPAAAAPAPAGSTASSGKPELTRAQTLLNTAQAARDRQSQAARAAAESPAAAGAPPRKRGFASFKVDADQVSDVADEQDGLRGSSARVPAPTSPPTPARASPPADAATRTAGAFGRFVGDGKRLPPDPDWADETIPPGSLFTREQWEAARREGEALNKGKPIYLVEIRNAGETAFLTLPAAPTGSFKKVFGPKGKSREEWVAPTDEELAGSFNSLMGQMIDGCLLLAPSAGTTHPVAASRSSVKFSTPSMGTVEYRIARPPEHMNTPKAIFATTRSTAPYPLVEPPWETRSDEEWNALRQQGKDADGDAAELEPARERARG
jgi:hypothetical protein